ncbi:GcrA cell cycle regulator, partial [Roseomonas eburnea]
MDWTTEAIERLKALWAEGHSTAEIGRRMGISKNAVVGKAHRLNLSARPSPIRRDAAPRPAPVPRAPRPVPAPAPIQ